MDEEMILLENVMPVEIALKRELEYRRKLEALRKQQESDSKNDTMILLENVMPVEIALKRELEYRRKLEALRKQPQQQTDSKNDTSHLKGPSPSLAGTKRKASSASSQGFCSLQPSWSQQVYQKQPAGLLCMACKVAFSTLHYLNQHCASQAHKGKLLVLKKGGKALSNPLLCELCNVSCSSGLTLEGHLNGTKHAASLQELESAKLGREEEAKLQNFNESTGIGDAFMNKGEKRARDSVG